MPERLRILIFLPAIAVLLSLFCVAAAGMPRWGSFHAAYGEYIAHMTVYERHATDTVNAINYDYRAFDTLGEEFILFSASVGVMMLLRKEHGAGQSGDEVQDSGVMSPTIRAVVLPIAALTVLFGFYIGVHGQLTPGGGFQAGVILASAALLLYLAENSKVFQRITSQSLVEVIEAAGAGAYSLIGFVSLCFGVAFLTNFMPLGKTGNVFSSGTIALISVTVGVEVTAAFLVVIYTYLQEILMGGLPED
jgi:multicomponent Na+:H+ antiporter subunit B